jgi:hypothetical protein
VKRIFTRDIFSKIYRQLLSYEFINNYHCRIIKRRFFRKRLYSLERYNMPKGKLKNGILFVSVAFNNSTIIKHQIRLIKKNIEDSYYHIIIDNSTNIQVRKEIKNNCIANNAGYVSLHKNPFLNPSESHGAALNWAVKRLVLKYCPAYFGFIDHDMYPVKSHCLIKTFNNQPFYGILQERENFWYLWPGFCFFSDKIYREYSLDFAPGIFNNVAYDTGGAIYNSVYHNFDKQSLQFSKQTYKNIREGELLQSDKIEIIDNWIHSFNGSYWMKVKDKEDILDKMLNDIYNESQDLPS